MTGAERIAAERSRQTRELGYTIEGDVGQYHGEAEHDLVWAAVAYAIPAHTRQVASNGVPVVWPWQAASWSPSSDDRIRELERAGALIAAEIDRLQAREASEALS